jgi:hypothetical protein
MFEGLRKPSELIVIVVTLLAFGCPVQAIVQAFGLDERTIASWRDRAGQQCQRVHQAIVEQGRIDLVHVQADEIRVKARGRVVWMGLALMVSTRLWVGGVISQCRDTRVGRSAPAAGAGLLQDRLRGTHLHRWVGSLSGQYQTRLSGEDQADGGTRASASGDLVGFAHRDRDQAHRRQAAHQGGASDESRHAGGGNAPLAALGWRADAQHVLHRTVQWHDAGTTGYLNAQMSACRSAIAGSGNRHALDRQYLQLLLFPSGTQQALLGRHTTATATNSCHGQWADGPSLESR